MFTGSLLFCRCGIAPFDFGPKFLILVKGFHFAAQTDFSTWWYCSPFHFSNTLEISEKKCTNNCMVDQCHSFTWLVLICALKAPTEQVRAGSCIYRVGLLESHSQRGLLCWLAIIKKNGCKLMALTNDEVISALLNWNEAGKLCATARTGCQVLLSTWLDMKHTSFNLMFILYHWFPHFHFERKVRMERNCLASPFSTVSTVVRQFIASRIHKYIITISNVSRTTHFFADYTGTCFVIHFRHH